MPPTIVSFPQIAPSFKAALVEILAPLFDGNVHRLGDTDIGFPVAKFSFDPHGMKELKGLVIGLVGTNVVDQKKHHVPNPANRLLPGVEVWADLITTVYVNSHITSGDRAQNRKTADEAWACLYAAIACSQVDLANRNIYDSEFPVIGEDTPVEDPTRVELIGIMRCQVTAKHLTYNTP